MTEESEKNVRSQEWAPAGSRSSRDGKLGGEGLEMDRLPPPAFPPGSHRAALRPLASTLREKEEGADAAPDAKEPAGSIEVDASGADEPVDSTVVEASEPSEEVELSEPEVEWAAGDEERGSVAEYGVATGMSEEGPIYGPLAVEAPLVVESGTAELLAAESLEALASRLREAGSEALRVGPATSPFDAMLRGLVAGYLAAGEEEGQGTR